MIRHTVLFNLQDDLAPSDLDWLFAQVRGLAELPMVKRFEIGKLLAPREEWYQRHIAGDFGWAITMEFDDEDALYAYQANPYHVTVAQEVRKRVSVIKV